MMKAMPWVTQCDLLSIKASNNPADFPRIAPVVGYGWGNDENCFPPTDAPHKIVVGSPIKESSFDNLQEKEEKFGFNEAPIDPETGERKKFFNLGPTSSWQGIVDERIINEINEKFETEMKELINPLMRNHKFLRMKNHLQRSQK